MEWQMDAGFITIEVSTTSERHVRIALSDCENVAAHLTPEQASDLASALLRANQEILGPRPPISDDVVAAIHEYVRNNRTDPGPTK